MRVRGLVFLAAASGLSACAAGRAGEVASAANIAPVTLAPDREMPADQQIAQALSRLTFGARPGDVDRVRAMGLDRWIALQLHPEAIPDAPGDTIDARFADLRTPASDLLDDFREIQKQRRAEAAANPAMPNDSGRKRAPLAPEERPVAQQLRRIAVDEQSAAVARAAFSERQLQEVMVEFWENHFSLYAGKGQTRFFIPEFDRAAIRPYALGKFRDLLGAVAHSPAMLFYLDNWQSGADSLHPTLAPGRAALVRRGNASRARGLNENYARELMELHTLGVDGGYTQQDVIEVARALTGWSIDLQSGGFVFRPALHDAGEKVVLGHHLRAGRGEEDGEEVLDILARSPATAHHLAEKLVSHFVSDSAPPRLVNEVADVYMRTDGDIRAMMQAIVESPEFFAPTAWRAKVKTPFELVVSTMRALNAPMEAAPAGALAVARLGQPIYGRQTPDGWPDRGDAWMNTGAILNRINFGVLVANGRLPGTNLAQWTPADSLSRLAHDQQVDGVIRALLYGSASSQTRAVLVNGRNPLAADSSMSSASAAQAPSLSLIVGLALGSPEFQRR